MTRALTTALLLVFTAAALAGALPANADPVQSGADEALGDAARRDQARTLVTSGTAAFNGHDFASALQSFQQAYQLFPDHKIQFNIGRAAMETGDLAVAANGLKGFLAGTLPGSALNAQRAQAQQLLSSVTGRVAELRIEVTPATATLEIDGQPLDVSAELSAGPDVGVADFFVVPGTHAVAGQGKGLTPMTQSITVRAAENRQLQLRLQPEAVGTSAAAVVTSKPVPESKPTAATESGVASTAESSSGNHTGALIIGGVGVAGLIASGILFGLASSSHSHAVQDVRSGASFTADNTAATNEQSASAGALALGVVGAGLGATLFFATEF